MKNVPKGIFFLFTALFLSECLCEIRGIESRSLHLIICLLIWAVIFLSWEMIRFVGLIKITEREPETGRKVGGDIIRTLAVLFVPYLHFFGQSGYYSQPLDRSYALATTVRWVTVCAVPIFMIITGYFKSEKKADPWHYKAIFPILLTHVVVSGIRILVDMKFHGIAVDADYIKSKLLYFEYGWYVRLYIGILVLLPFFNAVFEVLKSRRQRELFVLTLCSLGFLGPLTMDVVPSSWLILYVFGYYSIGLYIHKYKIQVSPIISLPLLAFLVGITAWATLVHSNGAIFDWDYFGYLENSGYSAFPVVVISALLMIICIDLRLPKAMALPFRLIGMVSLEMYLYSQLFDSFIYPYYRAMGYDFKMFFSRSLLVVGASIGAAFIASHITAFFTRLIKKPFGIAFDLLMSKEKREGAGKYKPVLPLSREAAAGIKTHI